MCNAIDREQPMCDMKYEDGQKTLQRDFTIKKTQQELKLKKIMNSQIIFPNKKNGNDVNFEKRRKKNTKGEEKNQGISF